MTSGSARRFKLPVCKILLLPSKIELHACYIIAIIRPKEEELSVIKTY